MERNFYDMTNISGKAVNDAKRIQAQTADYLARHDKQLQESLQAETDAKMNAAMSGARFGYAANVARSNARINKLNEEIRYTNESSVIGMTEMVAQVVEAGLLLDESELVKIYPEYKEDIRGIVKGFLKEGELNSVITKDETLQLMEYVSKRLPGVREGVTLTEDELSNYMAINKPLDIDKSIKNLGGDVATRVATLMEKEQKKAEQIEKDVKRAKAKETKMAANDEVPAEELMQALDAGEISEDDLVEMLQNGEISQNTYDQVVGGYEEQAAAAQDPNAAEMDPAMQGQTPVTTSAEAPVEGDPNAAEMDPAMTGGDPAAMGGVPAGVAPGMPKKQVQMLPDGTMNINIYEAADSALMKQNHMANGWSMSKQGRYDPEMLLGKGLGSIKSNLGLDISTIALALSIVGLPAAYGTLIASSIRRNNNLERLNSEQYKELRDYAMNDAKVKDILRKIKYELGADRPDKKVLEHLNSELKIELKRVKEEHRETLKEQIESLFKLDILVENDFTFVRETPRCGLIESLAVNEADTMIRGGKEYDGDLCLAKAIMYVTITEAMDELGLMNVDQKKYADIISAAGGNLNEKVRYNKRDLKQNPYLPTETPADAKYAAKVKLDQAREEYKNAGKKPLQESILVKQYVPVRNDISNGDSLAERIRQKRLNEQTSQSQILEERVFK